MISPQSLCISCRVRVFLVGMHFASKSRGGACLRGFPASQPCLKVKVSPTPVAQLLYGPTLYQSYSSRSFVKVYYTVFQIDLIQDSALNK